MTSGFVITVCCEEFFEDARKYIALYFHPDRMKTTKDLKQRLQCLIQQDFFLLWKPSSEECYYYLLDDEELHFVQSRDKFRLSKVNEIVSTKLSNGQAHLFTNEGEKTNKVNLEEEKEDKLIEQVDSSENKIENQVDLSEDLLMEYEDVVDSSMRKKRKRIRKHKSKKQKVEPNENITEGNGKEIEMSVNRLDSLNFSQTNEHSETNGRSHIRFQTEDANSRTNENVKQSEEMDVKIEYELYETDTKKKKKKSKKKPIEPCETNESILENIATCTSTPNHDKLMNVSSTLNNSNLTTLTALNSPSHCKPNPRRRSHAKSLASFITQLSNSLNSSRTENSKLFAEHDADPPDSEINNHEIKHSNDINSKTLETNPGTLGSSPNKSYVNNDSDLSNSHRRLSKKNKRASEINGTHYTHAVLENLQQLKQNNFPNMPLVFERKRGQVEIKDNSVDTTEPIGQTVVKSENKLENIEGCPESDPVSNVTDVKTPISNGLVKTEEITPMSNNIEERIAQIQSLSEDEVASLPLLKGPKDKDVILFKVLKMDASYNPTLSSFVCAEIKSMCEVTRQLSLDVLNGHEELVAPQGKFSLDQEEYGTKIQTEYSINWNELYDTRLLGSRTTPH
ncbi:hypothetical protein WDU94_015380 [Cyamophila willieti]